MGKSNIEWTDMVWNPVTGCTKVSPGCQNCYAERMAMRFTGHFNVTCHPDRLDQPLHWKKPRRIFVCSMGDLFHEDVPFMFMNDVVARISACEQHQFLILTKRPDRMLEWMTEKIAVLYEKWPLPNLWLGVTAENQAEADKRIPILLQIPAAKRFVSIEPMLSIVKLKQNWQDYLEGWTTESEHDGSCDGSCKNCPVPVQVQTHKLDWVIVGGESGPKARPMHPDWVLSIRDQCQVAGVPFFFKQWGEWFHDWNEHAASQHKHRFDDGIWMLKFGKKTAGRSLDGREWKEYPS